MSDETNLSDFERRTKRVFDDSVAGLDAATRSRLTQARHRALEERQSARGGWRWSLVPAGTLAATALVVWFTVFQGAVCDRRRRAIDGAQRPRDPARRRGSRDARRGARVLRLARGPAGVCRYGRQRRLMRSVHSALLALGCCWLAGAQAQEPRSRSRRVRTWIFSSISARGQKRMTSGSRSKSGRRTKPLRPTKDPEGSEKQEDDDDESE